MPRSLVFIWLGATALSDGAERGLEAWSRAHIVELEPARPGPGAPAEHLDELASRLEQWLTEARTALDALDDETAKRKLEQADRALERHPELPEAPWLRAEVLELRATRLERTTDPDSEAARNLATASELRAKARALAGPRADEYHPPSAAGAPAPRPPALPTTAVRIEGPRNGDEVYIDARPVDPHDTHTMAATLHHARVLRGSTLAWAGWVRVAADQHRLELPIPAPQPCTREDLQTATIVDGRVEVAEPIACPHWVAARPVESGVEVALCHFDRCDPLVKWNRSMGVTYEGPPQPERETRRWPAWLTWTLASVGGAATASLALWGAGVFDHPRPAPVVVRFTGPDAQ